MKLVCHIGNINGLFEIVQGCTFSEDYNETLDSGNIIIISKEKRLNDNGVEVNYSTLSEAEKKQLDIRPYDDVIIFDIDRAIDNKYWGWGTSVRNKYEGFYRHLLIDTFSEDMIYQGGYTEGINTVDFKYKIALFSEVKKLERIPVPRLSITQPIKNTPKKFISEYLTNYLNLYNPQIKKWDDNENDWYYVGKYSYNWNSGTDDLSVFETTWSPEFTLGESTFRELLTELFQVADRIPYVKDDVIYALDISKTRGNFDTSKGQFNFPVRSMSSSDYVTNLRTTYSDALPQEFSGHSVECVGFKNTDNAVMTLDNMRIELNFPIYKINRVFMHYYRSVSIRAKNALGNVITYSDYPILITQDITKLVKMDTEVLSKDWDEFDDVPIQNVDDAAKFDFSTVRYSQGSKYITGWGEKYQYPFGDWMDPQTKTHIENIFRIMDHYYPSGIYSKYTLVRNIERNMISNFPQGYEIFEVDIQGVSLTEPITSAILKNFFGTAYYDGVNLTEELKDIFFTVDYQPFYSGAVVHSKKYGDVNENLTSIDNPNNSLSLLERDGVAQREKLERFGVPTLQINGRYTDINDLQEAGTVYNSPYASDDLNKKIIIFHREYSVFDNVINCTYYGSQEYVLKNYYTSVFSKYRTYNLMSYGESVTRSENKKYYVKIDIDDVEQLEEKFSNENDLVITGLSDNVWLSALFFNNMIESKALNNAYYFVPKYKVWQSQNNNYNFVDKTNGYFATDFISFSTGNSIVFNISMIDNITGGTFWERPSKDIDWVNNTKEDLKGTTQNQYYIANYEDGTLYNIKFGLFNSKSLGYLAIQGSAGNNSSGIDVEQIKQRPLIDFNNITKNSLIEFSNYFYKDNKEIINLSLQFEYVCDENKKDTIFISPWFGRLNDLITKYYKQSNPEEIEPLELSYVSGLYVGYSFERLIESSVNNNTITYSINYQNAKSIPGGSSQVKYNDTGVGYIGDNNANGQGRFYMHSDFYENVCGETFGSGEERSLTYENPIIVVAIDKLKWNSVQGNEFNIDYSSGSMVLINSRNESSTSDKRYGNPYYRVEMSTNTDDDVDYVTELMISPKRIHINKTQENWGLMESVSESSDSETTTTYERSYINGAIPYVYGNETQTGVDENDNPIYTRNIPKFDSKTITDYIYNGDKYSFYQYSSENNFIDNGDINSFRYDGAMVDGFSQYSITIRDTSGNTEVSNYQFYFTSKNNLDLPADEYANTVQASYTDISNFELVIKGKIRQSNSISRDIILVYRYLVRCTCLSQYDESQATIEFGFITFNSLDGNYYKPGHKFRPLTASMLYSYVNNYLGSNGYDLMSFSLEEKQDFIRYVDSIYSIESKRNGEFLIIGNETTSTINTYDYTYTGDYNDNLVSSYIIADISYKTVKGGNTPKVLQNQKLILRKNNIENQYVFITSIRCLDIPNTNSYLNPLQLDFFKVEKAPKYLLDANSPIKDNAQTLSIGYGGGKFWNTSYSTSTDTTVGNVRTIRNYTYQYYNYALFELIRHGLSSNILSAYQSNIQDRIEDMNSYFISAIPDVFYSSETVEQYIVYGNLYYVLIKEELNETFKYKKYSFENETNKVQIFDITNQTTIEQPSYLSKDYVRISISSNLINQMVDEEYVYKSFAVFYKSNDNLGVWETKETSGSSYDDFIDEYNDNTNLHFVFGVNLDKINTRSQFTLSASILKSRDRRVFDSANKYKKTLK